MTNSQSSCKFIIGLSIGSKEVQLYISVVTVIQEMDLE